MPTLTLSPRKRMSSDTIVMLLKFALVTRASAIASNDRMILQRNGLLIDALSSLTY